MKLLDRAKVAFRNLVERPGRVLIGATASQTRTRSRVGDQWLEAYNQMPWLRATVGKIAGGVASLEWGITRTIGPDGKTTRRRDLQRAQIDRRQKILSAMVDQGNAEPVFEHPALDLLNDPCPLLEGKAFWILSQIYYEIPGEVFWLVERAEGVNEKGLATGLPVALWPIPPTWVTRTPTPDRPTFDIERGTMSITDIPPRELWWLKNPDPVNPYARGMGSALSLADELDADESAARMVSWSFYNRGQGDQLVSLPEATKKELDAFRNNWQANLVGVTNALKTHFVNVKAEVSQLSHDFQHLQVLELRKFSRDIVRQVQGIPPEVLGIVENSNRATIEAADFMFGKHVIIPRAEIWREFLQERLIPEYDARAVIDYVSPITEDKEFALKVSMVAPQAFKQNELRRLAGFDPLKDAEGGSLFFVNGRTYRSLQEIEGDDPAAPGLAPAGSPFSLTIPRAGGNGNSGPRVSLELAAPSSVRKKIEHRGDKWVVLSEAGKVLGEHDTEGEAVSHLAAIEAAKRRRRSFAGMTASPDEAAAIARYAKRVGYELDFDALAEKAPVPITDDRSLEYLRRTLARLRDDPIAKWEPLLGPWTEADDDMLDRMVGVRAWSDATA